MLAPRHLPRLAATVGLFTRYGLIDFAREQGIDALVKDELAETNGREPSEDKALALRKRLVELGPAYIKLGQVLATRSDLLPEAYIRELERLQDDVPPLPFAAISAIIEDELRARVSKLFDRIDEEPLGTASLGQAHAAALRDGREVVVKVQRPNILEPLARDLDFFRELARFLTERTATGRRVDMIGIVRQLERALADELDYRIEARNAAHFRRSLAEFPRILAPRVIEGYSTQRVLTTERIRGINVADLPPIARTELDLYPLADELTRAYLKQIAIDGFFHADPHPGNVFLVLPQTANPPTPAEIATFGTGESLPADTRIGRQEVEARREAPVAPRPVEAKIALIDFGMAAHLTPAARELSIRILFGLGDDRGDEVAEALLELGEPLPELDRAGYVREITDVVSRAYGSAVGEMEAGAILNEVITVSFQRGLRLPAELTLLAKALVHLGGVTRALDSSFEPAVTIRSYMQDVVAERARKSLNPRHIYRILSSGAELLGALPHRVDLITRRLANNELTARLEVPQVNALLEGLQKVANRIFSGLVLAGLIVASAMLLPHRRILGTTGFVIAGAIALYMVATIMWTDRRRRNIEG
jgi:predicted unusual protein kinase regulating ubiquinone biosynthesis (AarF/ABC1/UbiB family)